MKSGIDRFGKPLRHQSTMSLHANPSQEALERLQKQQRTSSITSLIIALLSVSLVAIVLGLLLLPTVITEPDDFKAYHVDSTTPDDPTPPKVSLQSQRKPSSPAHAMTRVIAAQTLSPLSIPVTHTEVTNPSVDFGDGDDSGIGGDDDALGRDFRPLPPSFASRCSREDRLARLQETGGTPECEDAVVKALDWLKATQSADGSWTGSNQAAMTGLALLAYLGHCETPLSKDYSDTVLRAITYLVNLGMKTGGKLSVNLGDKHWPYEHAIATYALAEAATFCKLDGIHIPNLLEITQLAGQFIIDNQHSKSGGWDYSYDVSGSRGGDLSIAAWQIQALKACHHTGLEFKGLSRAANKAMDYVNSLRCKDGGFAYSRANETPHAEGYRTMTGAGLLCLQMFDKGSMASARQGAKYIQDQSKFDYKTRYADLYGHYYEAQAMMNRGGQQWKWYNDMFRDQLLKNQNTDGSWPPPGDKDGVRAVAPQFVSNVHYRTCLNTLMLEVYYRFLPGTGAGVR
jgi:hypothetical protein